MYMKIIKVVIMIFLMLFLLLSLCHVTFQYQPIVGIVAFPSEYANRDKCNQHFLVVSKVPSTSQELCKLAWKCWSLSDTNSI